MSTDFRTCPSCKTMVLADTYQCTHCGHVFDEHKSQQLAQGTAPEDLKSASLEEECGNCGAMVRSGLVRCWNCNGFMREDIARRYQQLATTPQKIIYSDIPADKRTDYLPPRVQTSGQDGKAVAELMNDFTLRSDGKLVTTLKAEDEFTLDDGVLKPHSSVNVPRVDVPQVSAPEIGPSPQLDGPDKPRTTTPGTTAGSSANTAAKGSEANTAAKGSETTEAAAADDDKSRSRNGAAETADASAQADDLLSNAIAEEAEADRRKGRGARGTAVTQILIPCPRCSNLVRASDQQAGKKVRCPKCRGPVAIPALPAPKPKKKGGSKAKVDEKARVDVTWVNDAWLHVFAPTSVVLKPGSMADPHSMVDIAMTDAGMFLVSYGKEAGKSGKKAAADAAEGGVLSFVRTKLFGFLGMGSTDVMKAADDLRENYKQVRQQVAKTGEFKDLPNADVKTIDKEQLSLTKLVQPVIKAHESMFAGVPVFGEGRIALYLPLESEDGQQNYLSLPISAYRILSATLKKQFGLEFPAAENGVPETEKSESLSCFLDQTKFEAIQDVIYYEQDPAFELELVGHRCAACSTTISEEGRRKKKLGGATAKGLAKAKCPKCSAKFGTGPLYRITRFPEAAAASSSEDSHAA